jgi:hypothetical protein
MRANQDKPTALLRLVGRAAALDPDDAAIDQVRVAGHRLTARLAAADALPPHLVVALDDPPVVVLRLLAQAARRSVRQACEGAPRRSGSSATARKGKHPEEAEQQSPARTRPAPDTWSALEYTCHVRVVLRVQRERLQLARGHRPRPGTLRAGHPD